MAQADRDGVALSDVERKMLYFSETGWTLPEMMAVSREFDESYDQDEYEVKIGGIVGRIRNRPGNDRDEDWDKAVELLKGGDHYLLVLLASAGRGRARKERWETARLIVAGVVVAVVWIPFSFFVFSWVQNQAVAGMLVGSSLLGLAILAAWVGNRGRWS